MHDLLAGEASPSGPAAACLRLLDQRTYDLFVSEDILREVLDVLARPKVRRKNALLTDERVQEFIEQVRRAGTRIDPVPARFAYPRDPKDEPYLNLALACDADFLVSWDNDLLDLMTSELDEGTEFRKYCPRLAIVPPPTFLRILMGPPKASSEVPPKPVAEREERQDDAETSEPPHGTERGNTEE